MGRAQRWQITDNTFEDNDDAHEIIKWIQKFYTIRYGIYCVEKAPTTDHLYMHAYLKFEKQLYGSKLKRIIPTAHLEQCKGVINKTSTTSRKEDVSGRSEMHQHPS